MQCDMYVPCMFMICISNVCVWCLCQCLCDDNVHDAMWCKMNIMILIMMY